MADVLVLGSLNMDLVARVDRLPRSGETLTGNGFATVPGGKGANQAVAAARLGTRTAMVGRVGTDGFGKILRDRLQTEKIDVSAIAFSTNAPSGTALIAVAPDDNQIIVIPGANGEVDEADLLRLMPYFERAKVLLLQFEIPLPTVEKAAALAYQAGLTVIVDPAPATEPLPLGFGEYISILTPNQTEAALLTGQAVEDEESAIAAATILHQQGIEVVIIKMGALGSVCVTADACFTTPAFPVKAIDTVAAGDAFNGGLATALVNSVTAALGDADDYKRMGASKLRLSILKPAITYASAVAALAVTRPGAQLAMPTKLDVDAFLSTRR
ncbi:MAG: ribokinase [Phormidesmis sp.]